MGGALLLSNGGHGHGEELDKQERGEREMTPERVESERLGMGKHLVRLGVHFRRAGAHDSGALLWWGRALVHGGQAGNSSNTWFAAK